ncbi:MAG TPA: hypothetical protein VHE58_02945 [Burkholderiales bacterium]|nr:hypothetical protein [Burkholderiales bacterium]
MHQVNIKKNPALANLGSRNLTRARLLLQGNGVDVQELRGFLEGERIHGYQTRRTESAIASAGTLKHSWKASGRSITERLPDTSALRQERMVNSPAAGRGASV